MAKDYKPTMGGRGSSSGKVSGRGAKSKAQPPPYTTDKDGVRNYAETEEGAEAFYALSDNYVKWNKGAFIDKKLPDGRTMSAQVKRAQIWDFLKDNNINEFRFIIGGQSLMTEKQVQRVFKQLSDYGYYVAAKFREQYYVSKKSYRRLKLDFSTETVYKRGAKG